MDFFSFENCANKQGYTWLLINTQPNTYFVQNQPIDKLTNVYEASDERMEFLQNQIKNL